MLTKLRQRLEQEKGKLEKVQEQKRACVQALDDLQQAKIFIEQAQTVFQMVAQQTQQELEFKISDLVTMALEAVPFSERYSLHLEFIQRRGRTEADLYLTGSSGNKVKILDAAGGGVANVVAFALRVSLWALSKSSRSTLVFDEPFPFLRTKEAHAKVGQLLRDLSSRLGLQIIMITGEVESQDIVKGADKVFRFSKKRGVSLISESIENISPPTEFTIISQEE